MGRLEFGAGLEPARDTNGGHPGDGSRTMTAGTHRTKKDLYRHLVREMIEDPAVTEATMMGLPCLRLNGVFFAALDRSTSNLIVKLRADRVAELTETGIGSVFAPNNRPFREWVAIARLDESTWTSLMHEAKAFAGSARSG